MYRSKIFIAYARNDKQLRDELLAQLKYLEIDGMAEVFHDGLIAPNEKWDAKLQMQIRQADIIVFLLSSSLIDSTYVMNDEVPPAMDRHDSTEAVVVSVLLSHVNLPAIFAEREYLMSHDDQPIACSANKERALCRVAKKIEEFVRIQNGIVTARGAGISALTLKEVKGILEKRLNDPSSVCLCSRTGMGWERDLHKAICALSDNLDKASKVRFLLLDPDGPLFKLDSAVNWKSDPESTDERDRFAQPARTPDQRRRAARNLYNDLHKRGHQVRVTNVFLPQAFWAIATDKSTSPNNAIIEVPVWRSRHGGNLYLEATGTNEHVKAYVAIFNDLWEQAKDWVPPTVPTREGPYETLGTLAT